MSTIANVTGISLRHGLDHVIWVKSCIGFNYTNGVPSDYEVTTRDGKKLLIPRENVAMLHLADEQSEEAAA